MITNYKELPLGKYMDIIAAVEKEEDPLKRQVTMIGMLNDLTEDEVLNLPLAEYKEKVVAASFMQQPCPENLMRAAETVRLGKWELKATKDYRKILTSQYVDYLNFVKDAEHNIPQILSVFLIPKGCKYNEGYDIVEVQAAIRQNMSVADALGMAAFFLERYVASIKASLGFSRRALRRVKGSRKEEMTAELERLTNLLQNGDGSPM